MQAAAAAAAAAPAYAQAADGYATLGTKFTCFTSTKAQILQHSYTPLTRLSHASYTPTRL